MHIKNNEGFGMIEILIAVGILSTVLFSFYNFFRQAIDIEQETTSLIRADYLILEGVDILKMWRDQGYASYIASLATSTPYYFEFDSGAWVATTTPNVVDGFFIRQLMLLDVVRDGDDSIAQTGVLDPGTKHAFVSVEWHTGRATTSESTQIYVMDIFNN
jgi:hypothetical protein